MIVNPEQVSEVVVLILLSIHAPLNQVKGLIFFRNADTSDFCRSIGGQTGAALQRLMFFGNVYDGVRNFCINRQIVYSV